MNGIRGVRVVMPTLCLLLVNFLIGCSSTPKSSISVSNTRNNTTVNSSNQIDAGAVSIGTNGGIAILKSSNVNAATVNTMNVGSGGVGINQGNINNNNYNLTHEQLQDLADMINQGAKLQKTPNQPDRPIDYERAIREWAAKYNLTPELARQEVTDWVEEVHKKRGDDKQALALAEFLEKNYEGSARLYSEAATDNLMELVKLRRDASALLEEQRLLAETAATNYNSAGDSFYKAQKFAEALDCYSQALPLVDRQTNAALWAQIRFSLGVTHTRLATTRVREIQTYHLAEALNYYTEALQVYALDQTSEQWAIIQNNIGTILSGEATTMKREEGQRTLVKAVNALRQALKASQSSRRRVVTQYNLATALSQQGRLVGGKEGRKLFAEAVSLFRQVLEEYEREQLPHELEWVSTKNNLGHALQGEAAVADPGEVEGLLAEAVNIFREVIDVYTRAQLPREWGWATTQRNLGNALTEQGKRAVGGEGQRLFSEAVTAYREALKLESRQESPQVWAETQLGLGTALEQQGLRLGEEEEKKLLADAVDAFNEALTVYTREQMPESWAQTQINLGVALAEQGRRAGGGDGQRLLNEAADAFQSVLKVCTREQMPQEWAMAQRNLGLVFMEQYELDQSSTRVTILNDAIAAFRNALDISTEKNDPQAHQVIISLLNEALALKERTDNSQSSTK